MRNIFRFLFASLFIVTFSCVDSENTIDTVLDYETGAILRTIKDDPTNNYVLNSSEPDSQFSVMVEEQDEQDGDLLKQVNVYTYMRDLTPENGDSSTSDYVYVSTVDGSAFSTGPVGLPRGAVTMTFGAAASAMGLSSDDYLPGDVFVVGLEVELTDGRKFDWTSAAGIITGGFFSSPFKYNALLTCSPEPGDYVVNMVDSYGDGWQGGGISVNIDGTVVYATICDEWGTALPGCLGTGYPNNTGGTVTITIPPGTVSAIWDYAGDAWPSEVSFQIYAPDGTMIINVPPGGIPAQLLPVAVCAQ